MNKTGIKPVEYKVLVLVDKVDEIEGSIWKPKTTQEREQYAHDKGTIVDMGGLAFSDWNGTRPQVGFRVIFSKYEGKLFPIQREGTREFDNYRIINDKDIMAILEEEHGTAS